MTFQLGTQKVISTNFIFPRRPINLLRGLFAKHYLYVKSVKPFKENINCSNLTCACRVLNFLWISHRLKLIYIETPKCGCSFVKKSLELKMSDEIIAEHTLGI